MKKVLMVTLFVILLSANAFAKTFTVALFTPKGDSPFWTLVAHFAAEAAHDLGLELRIYDAKLNHFTMREQVKAAVTGPDKVDAIVFQNFKKTAPDLIRIAEEAQVFAFCSTQDSVRKLRKIWEVRGKSLTIGLEKCCLTMRAQQ